MCKLYLNFTPFIQTDRQTDIQSLLSTLWSVVRPGIGKVRERKTKTKIIRTADCRVFHFSSFSKQDTMMKAEVEVNSRRGIVSVIHFLALPVYHKNHHRFLFKRNS